MTYLMISKNSNSKYEIRQLVNSLENQYLRNINLGIYVWCMKFIDIGIFYNIECIVLSFAYGRLNMFGLTLLSVL